MITGSGIVAANGVGHDAFWSSLISMRSGIVRVDRNGEISDSGSLVGQVRGFDPAAAMRTDVRKASRHSRTTQMAYAAALEAMAEADARGTDALARDAGWLVLIGVSLGGLHVFERELTDMLARGRQRMPPSGMASVNLNTSTLIRDVFGLKARVGALTNTCAGGLDAILQAAGEIRRGETTAALAGGSDAPIAPAIMSGFDAVGMMSHFRGDAERASRPFDILSEGAILAEGAAVVVMESLQSARFRGARPIAEVLGGGVSSDPPGQAPGSGLEESMVRALADASVLPSDIQYISAHGPGEPAIDREEGKAIVRVFKNQSRRIPLSSIKGVTGNPLAAGGPMQVVSCLLAMRHGRLPPTANLEHPDPALALDLIRNEPRGTHAACMLVNSHGMGGVNTSLVLRVWRDG
ncbi:MAG: beta-ketoacyl-[acyl-carrier-protein] synthase family protein [Kiritimatiellia bacterium]